MKFIVDGMLGKLARWLRMLGHDVAYSVEFDDAELESMAKTQNRILLTRDFELYRHAISKGTEAFYVDGQNEPERLAEVAIRFGVSLMLNMQDSRCPKCNGKVHPVVKEKIAGKVRRNTFSHYDAFWECSDCGQVYWQGAHWTKIRIVLQEAQNNMKKEVEA